MGPASTLPREPAQPFGEAASFVETDDVMLKEEGGQRKELVPCDRSAERMSFACALNVKIVNQRKQSEVCELHISSASADGSRITRPGRRRRGTRLLLRLLRRLRGY